jgi:inositol phosphorylceramide synthase catalytic subunit
MWLLAKIRDWPAWWTELSLVRKLVPATAVLLYWLTLAALGGLRTDHVIAGLVLLLSYYGGRTFDSLRLFVLPFLLTGILYDSQRFYGDLIRGPIHVREPYYFDQTYFGIQTPEGALLTPNEWWQLHTRPWLDLLTGGAYLVFFGVFIAQSAYFYFWLGRPPAADTRTRARLMIWAFFWLNVLGYSTYYWYAASPPWYVAKYGLGPADPHVQASAAGCVRFDALLGTRLFSQMYGRAADVHGAIPSLHVAYPFLALLFALRFRRLRVFSLCFYLLMCFSAVYLNHHYILDVLWGTAYAVLVSFAVERASDWLGRERSVG